MQEEKDTMEKQISDLKTLNLNLETNLQRQQNKETQQTEQGAISRQSTDRTDQERDRKENTKIQGRKEIKKYAMHVSQIIMRSKTVTQGKISLLLTEQADQ